MFKQLIHNGQQLETPDYWLIKGNPWEICRNEITYPIRFYGNVVWVTKDNGELKVRLLVVEFPLQVYLLIVLSACGKVERSIKPWLTTPRYLVLVLSTSST
jgi:glucan phosphorylase